MIQAVFFDIDGTLIDTSTHSIPVSTLIALQELRNHGYKLGIASGRDHTMMQEIQGLDLRLFDGIVASNGMCIFNEDMHCIKKHSYPAQSIADLLTYAKQHQMTLVFESMEDMYTANEINTYVDIANTYYQETTPHKKQWQGEEIIKISCFQTLDYDFSSLEKQLHVRFLPTPTTTYDVILPYVSKLSGIHELMKYWRLPQDNFMCFGDHDNDMEMIQGAKLGIAVKDPLGSKQLQALADDVCEAAAQDGIYHYLKRTHMI